MLTGRVDEAQNVAVQLMWASLDGQGFAGQAAREGACQRPALSGSTDESGDMMTDGVPGVRAPVKAAAAHSQQDVHPGAGDSRAVAGAGREHQWVRGQKARQPRIPQAAWPMGSGAASAAPPSSRSV